MRRVPRGIKSRAGESEGASGHSQGRGGDGSQDGLSASGCEGANGGCAGAGEAGLDYAGRRTAIASRWGPAVVASLRRGLESGMKLSVGKKKETEDKNVNEFACVGGGGRMA